nr:LamG-like jellyroll fold domain-containing protein [Nocardioides thalensis]
MADATAATLSWPRLALLVASRAYRASLLVLVAVALAPLVLGWSSYAVRTGSMEPSIAVGDIVVAQPLPEDTPPDIGRVMVFENPAADDGQLLVHRVIADLDDGTYTTAGDANPLPDTTPVPRDAFEARGVLLAPYAGLPLAWLQNGELLAFALWLSLTIAAFVLASDPSRPRRRHKRRRPLAVAAAIGVSLTLVLAATAAVATFTGTTSTGSNSWTVGHFRQPYVSAVLADRPYLLHLLDEEQGTWAADSSGNGRTGRFTSIGAHRTPGGLPNNHGYSVHLGTAGRVVSDTPAIGAPDTFTLEVWFRTTTTRGGPLMGFESSRDARSGTNDRQLAMTPSGRLVYGAWDAPTVKTIQSARSYNDGRWHHAVLVANNQGSHQVSTVYVDGAPVASDSTSRTSYYTGWWRIGAGTLSGPGTSVAAGFDGHVDNAAVYLSPLSGARVAAHYAAR